MLVEEEADHEDPERHNNSQGQAQLESQAAAGGVEWASHEVLCRSRLRSG
jgi:hypothetical protein